MKKTSVKLAALGLSVVIALGGAGSAVYACAAASESADEAAPAAAVRLSAAAATTGPAAYRDETVYVFAGPGGEVERIVVSDWLKNPEGLARLEDAAALTGVENVKGWETSTPSGAGRIWDAMGSDIYCQGGTDQELPVDVSISYALNGQPIAPDQLAGKSGKVTIRFDYDNRQYQDVTINGKTERICVPFAVVTAVVLDEDRFTNVEAANARISSDGGRLAVAGMALPGLRESLGLEEEDLAIPEYVEITADVTDFELETTFTVAASGLFGELDADRWSDAGELSDSLGEMEDAMEQLLDGSGRLYDGLGELLAQTGGLSSGVEELAAGASALQSGAKDLGAGAAQLKDGAAALQTGLEQLTASSDTLNGGAEQVFESLLTAAAQQLSAAGAQIPALTAENYGQILDSAAASLGESPAAGQITALKASLDGYNAFYQGLRQYTAGVDQAAGGVKSLTAGAASLSQGANALSDGAAQLNGGLQSLRQNVPALIDGVTKLHDGAGELADGLEEFNEKAVQKLIDAFDGDLDLLIQRAQAVVSAAKDYRSFSGGSEADGQVKFIYRTAAVKAE